LTVVALCSVVAVLAVLATETTHPYGGGTPNAGADPGYVYDPSATGDPTDDSSAPADDPSDATDTVADNTDVPAAARTTDEPAPLPAPPVVAIPQNPVAQPPPVSVPIPGPTTTPPTTRPAPSPSPQPAGPAYFEAESSANSLSGTRTYSCAPCSGGKKVGNIGRIGSTTGTVIFNNVRWGNGGPVVLVISYVNGDSKNRTAQFSVNGAAPITITFGQTGNWNTVKTLTVKLTLKSGANQVKLTNPTVAGPDLDMITVRSP
jgi:hypothetical protein